MYLVKYFNLFFAGLIFIGCSDYQKLLNSDNLSEKYKVAELFYNNGEYRKASRLFEQIIPKYRGKPQSQRIIYFLADSYFLDKNFYLAANQFENFIKSYPKSDRIVEAQFKEAKSFLPEFYSQLMKIAKTGTINKKTVSRKISKITKQINNSKKK